MTRRGAAAVATAALGVLLASRAQPVAQQGAVAPPGASRSPVVVHRPVRPTYGTTGQVDVLPVQGSVYLLAGAGSNVVVQVGEDALFVVDTNEAAMSGKMLEAVRSISKLPIRYIVNTSGDPDRVGGNEAFAKSAGTNVNQFLNQGARVYAHELAYNRMANPGDGAAPLPVALWPTDAFLGPKKTLFVTGEPIELIHQPKAHTDGDLLVFFRKSDVVAAGGLFVLNSYPVIDVKHGGSLQGIIDGLNRLIDLAIPEFNAMGGTRIIPGNGRITNEIDVVEYRDAMTIIRDRVAALVAEGRSLADVKAARVSLDYDGIYGTTSGPWTTDMFIDAAYRELSATVPRTSRRATPARPQVAAAAAAKPVSRRQSSDPFDGLWALNTAKSRYEPLNTAPYRREINLVMNGEELTQETSTWRRGLGNNSPLAKVSYTARFDGKEYPVPASTSKVTLKRIGPTTIERTATGDRSAREAATWALSADRKTLTIETTGVDAAGTKYSSTQVYDRMP
jgi:glyoxylase-like metal-dependent hydrolase (beta-lactamase superfamily II)